MHLKLIDVRLLYCGHQRVSASHVAIFSVISLRTRIRLQLKYVESLHSIRKTIIWFLMLRNTIIIIAFLIFTLKMATLWMKHVGDHNTIKVHQ